MCARIHSSILLASAEFSINSVYLSHALHIGRFHHFWGMFFKLLSLVLFDLE